MAPRQLVDLSTLSSDTRDYIAGIVDTEGSWQVSKPLAPSLSVPQAQRGASVLKYLHDMLGGVVRKTIDETDAHQASFQWTLGVATEVVALAKWLEPRMTVKRREAALMATFPIQNTHIIDIIATNKDTGETKIFSTLKEAAKHFGRVGMLLPIDSIVEVKGTPWTIRKALSSQDVIDIKNTRQIIRNGLMEYHNKVHDEIPKEFRPSLAYTAGIVDGDGCLDVHGKNSQHHTVKQKDRPLLEMLQREYGGTIWRSNHGTAWSWSIYDCDQSDRLLANIEPFIIGKKAQAQMILNMKPGEAPQVHAALRDLKGNFTAPTPMIDKINAGEDVNNFKLPPAAHPVGVYQLPSGRWRTMLTIDQVHYTMGVFDTVEEADEYRRERLAYARKQIREGNKEKLIEEWQQYLKENSKKKYVLPPAEKTNELHIYPTKSNTYQVKHCLSRRCFGTYDTLAAAKEVRDREIPKLLEELLQEKMADTEKNIHEKNGKFTVRFAGKNYGTFRSRQDAITARNAAYREYEDARDRGATSMHANAL